ncbi:hypothetical protein BGP34_28470 [Bacillus mycoides]|nr:hypothetical protein BW891_18730 [Bacillus mycoides]OOR53213.1 hypothetical protein BGP34_28470 [Bacillus mycoides]
MFYGSMHFFIHSYPGAVLGFLFVTGLAEKLYKTLHALSMVFFRNAGGGQALNNLRISTISPKW